MPLSLIAIPSRSLQIPAMEFQDVVDASHAVVVEAKAAGVYRFCRGIDETVAPVLIGADGSRKDRSHPLRTPSTVAARCWTSPAGRRRSGEPRAWPPRAGRGPQELSVFGDDPAS